MMLTTRDFLSLRNRFFKIKNKDIYGFTVLLFKA